MTSSSISMTKTGEFYDQVMDKFSKKTHLKWVFSHVFAHKGLISLFFIFATISAAIGAITPLVLGKLINFNDCEWISKFCIKLDN